VNAVRYPDVTCAVGRDFLDRPNVDGVCRGCGKTPLPPRRTVWCSDKCVRDVRLAFLRNHDWHDARRAALKRDKYRCVKCGSDGQPPASEVAIWECLPFSTPRERAIRNKVSDALTKRYQLEVNHIDPRRGRGYAMGCHHHLDRLETVCHPCHVEITHAQRRDRVGVA
jgi:hypothetical protein